MTDFWMDPARPYRLLEVEPAGEMLWIEKDVPLDYNPGDRTLVVWVGKYDNGEMCWWPTPLGGSS